MARATVSLLYTLLPASRAATIKKCSPSGKIEQIFSGRLERPLNCEPAKADMREEAVGFDIEISY